ncbi:cell wall hydrolase [Bacillus sp. 31A1R]|uniref:Cell wall hydrolase n=1 Tax=Robertmurraya mangrovi TaxID=3098077 RepID=A0ABU5J1V5_9BACI|nr:cell wall hydrolase [Bacillus sp. 31A1R]MDZ5473379.1 cell wall hydrolase [Bacillus sp. 31A1R]
MKKIKKLLVGVTLSLSLFSFNAETGSAASSYQVKAGETYWTVANKFGVSVNNLKKVNNKTSDLLFAGERIVIPKSISNADKELLARLVSAEAKGEPYAGKVAVATVVLNRVDSEDFPNSIKGVIYENVKGHYAFEPVQNGTISLAADADSKKAVEEAIAFRGQGRGSLYFFNPKTASSKWVFSREVTVTIGNHRFAK